MMCFVLILTVCVKLRCQLISGGQKTRDFSLDRIEVIPDDNSKSNQTVLGPHARD
jgi:hypothetical protein